MRPRIGFSRGRHFKKRREDTGALRKLAKRNNSVVTIRIRILALLEWVKIRAIPSNSWFKKLKKSLPGVSAPNKTGGQTGKSVDAAMAVRIQRRFTLKFHRHHNHP
jgi:hypothetical protein